MSASGFAGEAPVTIVRELPEGGHYTVRAESPAEALQLLAQLDQALGRQAAAAAPELLRPATFTPAPAPVLDELGNPCCPEHKTWKQGRWGPYCPARLEDGSWCRWRAGKLPMRTG